MGDKEDGLYKSNYFFIQLYNIVAMLMRHYEHYSTGNCMAFF